MPQKPRASEQYLFAVNCFYSRREVEKLTGLTKHQVEYLSTILKLIKPTLSLHGNGSYYTFNQLQEFLLVKKLKYDYSMTYSKLSRAKKVLHEIDSSLSLADKSVLFGYGELFYLNTDLVGEKMIQLTKEHNGQKSLFVVFKMMELEQELDNQAKVINLLDYKKRKTLSNIRFVA